MSATAPWWRTAVIYQIYPRSFLDADGDGVGDLEGIRRKLDHLTWLGVDAIWLSPIYPSPMADFGYDVSDYCDIDPVFGDLEKFDGLLEDLHRADIRIMLDWVANHTSDRHPWFVESRSSRQSPKRDWYVWRDSKGGSEPNNWPAAFGGPAWTLDEQTDQRYLHLFLPQQPDLRWANPEVATAMHDVLRFWLDRGVDGFRADVVHLIGKDETLPDRPPELAGRDLVSFHDDPTTHPLLRDIRRVLNSYPGDRAMVGEVNLRSPDLLAPYYGEGDELHLVFNFSLLWARWEAARWAEHISAAEAALATRDAWPVWVLSNHDRPRHRTRFGSEPRARVAAVVLLTLRGTPFLYAGEELGLEDAQISEEQRVDPGFRDGCRAPIPWTAETGHGWAGTPWLPFAPDPQTRNVRVLQADENSILHLYRRLLRVRKRSAALQLGTWRQLEAPPDVLAYERVAGDDARIVLANFVEEPATVDFANGWRVQVCTERAREDTTWEGSLGPNEAVVLQRG